MSKFAEWELNLLEVDDASEKSKSRLRFLYKHVRDNALQGDGDILEFGTFRGASALALALILRELGSSKTVFAFDTFSGFPSLSSNDTHGAFQASGSFSPKFLDDRERYLRARSIAVGDGLYASTVPRIGDFSETSVDLVRKKIDYLGLNNIELVVGRFEETVPDFFAKHSVGQADHLPPSGGGRKVSACNIDCDLYDGYRTILPFVYGQLSVGGYIHLDEYFSFKYPGPKIATDEFCRRMGIEPKREEATRPGEFERWFITKQARSDAS